MLLQLKEFKMKLYTFIHRIYLIKYELFLSMPHMSVINYLLPSASPLNGRKEIREIFELFNPHSSFHYLGTHF